MSENNLEGNVDAADLDAESFPSDWVPEEDSSEFDARDEDVNADD
jgi:hypothetical protein